MGLSAVVEPNLTRLAALLGLESLTFADGSSERHEAQRLQSETIVPVVRQAAAGRLVVECMRYKPYVIDRRHLAGDMFADALLGSTHGLIALRLFSEWLSPSRLVAEGIVPPHEVHCAYNRYQIGGDLRERMVLGNFMPVEDRLLLTPVLYAPTPEGPAGADFVLICDAAPPEIAALGGRLAPVSLDQGTALSWLATAADDDTEAVDFAALISGHRLPAPMAVGLYRSA
jgi:hypothetical protein